MLQRKMLSFLFMMIFIPSVCAQWKDSTRFINKERQFETTYNKISENKVYQMLRIPVPLFAISAITYRPSPTGREINSGHYAIRIPPTSITDTMISCNILRYLPFTG